ncbi:MAG: glycoside hydrolase family 3 C-terminal domain-containing protein [Clostridia bacterium]|nr:glycoside hydrolase family 3 C-terminal domain-containing protein [Clostridia bacterium]
MKDHKKKNEELTTEEKISLLSGADAWHTVAIESAGIPSIKFTDGANGVRNGDIVASCFPSPVAVASSFDEGAAYLLGAAMAEECTRFGTDVLLAPSMNIKRSPLCGRNFGYYSEDPVVSGKTAAAFVNGVQSKGVGACVKHFAVYNQETRRMTYSSEIDDVALREIYLKGFEIAVKNSHPACVMTSYNFCNGTHASENKKFITDILRNEWGFDGAVVSDWGGVHDRAEALKAGLDVQMPHSSYGNGRVKRALERGDVSPKDIDAAASRVIRLAKRFKGEIKPCDFEKSKKVALDVALKSVVLLKNNDAILPLKKKSGKITVIGEGAVNPAIQGGGCDHMTLLWKTDFLEEIKQDLPDNDIAYSRGYSLSSTEPDAEEENKAVFLAKNSQTVIFFFSMPEFCESEAFDRKTLDFPQNQLKLFDKILKVNKNVVAVMLNGAPVGVKKIKKAAAIVEGYLLGGVCGKALSQILSGKVSPSGKLAETFPLRIEDTPAYLGCSGMGDKVVYREGEFVGYRYYLTKKIKTAFPFGYGLSYTTFEFSDVSAGRRLLPNGSVKIHFTVKNTGKYAGAEVAQIYVGKKDGGSDRPVKELKNYVKIYLKPNESKKITLTLDENDFSRYDETAGKSVVNNGNYTITLGTSCVDAVKEFGVSVCGFVFPFVFTRDTRIGEALKTARGRKIVEKYLLGYLHMAMFGTFNGDITLKDDVAKSPFFTSVMNDMPLRALCNFTDGKFGDKELENVISVLNEKNIK